MTIKPKLMTDEDLAIVRGRHEFFRVGDVDAVWCIRLLAHAAAQRELIDRLRNILMLAPDLVPTSHEALIERALELLGASAPCDRRRGLCPPTCGRAAGHDGDCVDAFTPPGDA